jgi:hypothetical protein
MNNRRIPAQRCTTESQPEDVTDETTAATYSRAELLALAEAAEAPTDVLQALHDLAPQARFRYLAELWAPEPGSRER